MGAAPRNQVELALGPGYGYLEAAACFLRSAQRRFIASAMRLRPSGLILRLLGAVFAEVFAFLLPLGRPRPLPIFTAVPESRSRACCSFDI